MFKFTKMHGCGNDYIYIDNRDQSIDIDEFRKEIPQLCDRHKGIGADGVIFIVESSIADAGMRMFNADASEGKMCGNGIRCVARFVYDNKIVTKKTISIETASGVKKLLIDANDDEFNVTVDMGEYSVKSEDIPVLINKESVINELVTLDNKEYHITCVSMGNPHVVLFVDNVDEIDLEEVGPKWENNPLFPERINTEFVELIDNHTLKFRVWERGSGETLACGTGACAVVVAGILNGYLKRDEDIRVILKGGELVVRCSEDNHVFLKGNAVVVFEGVCF